MALTVFSQTPTTLDSAVGSVIDKKINAYDSTLAKMVTITYRTVGAQTATIDTLLFPGFRTALYNITALYTNVATGECGGGQRAVMFRNTAGTYFFVYGLNNDGAGNTTPTTALKKAGFNVNLPNTGGKFPTLVVIGIAGLTLDWFVTYTATLQK